MARKSGSISLPKYGQPRRTEKEVVTEEGRAVDLPEPPLATLGIPLPFLQGRKRIFQPNIMWFGNLRPIVETSTTTETVCWTETFKGEFFGTYEREVCKETTTITKTVVGYYLSIQFGIALGPDVHLRNIYIDDEVIWTGDLGSTNRNDFTIDPNDTFMAGDAVFSAGSFSQVKDTFLAGLEDVDPAQLPGYPGIAHLIVKDVRLDQIGGRVSFEIERFPDPLGLGGASNRLGDDLNVASALADFLTNDWGGCGLNVSDLDTTTFAASAATLATEGNGSSLLLMTETSATSIIGVLSDQADGVVYENPATGQIDFKLIRFANINPASAVKFSEGNVTRLQDWFRPTWVNTFNKMRVRFINREDDYEEASVLGYNFNAINDQIAQNRTSLIDYWTCHTAELAQDLLARDLSYLGQPVFSVTLETDRTVGSILPGDAASVYLPRNNVSSFVGYVQKVQSFGLRENKLLVTIQQVPRTDNALGFTAEEKISVSFDTDVAPPTGVTIKQAPYWFAKQKGIGQSAVEGSSQFIIPMFFAEPANDIQFTFDAYVVNKPGFVGSAVEIIKEADYPAIATLNGAIDQLDGLGTGIITSVDIDGVTDDRWLRNVGTTGIANGELLIFIDDEILSCESVTDNGSGSWTLNNVHRALIDTAPEDHLDNADVFITGNNFNFVSGSIFSYSLTYTPTWRITSNVGTNKGDPLLAGDYLTTSTWDASFNRARPPVRPHATSIDTSSWGRSGLSLTEPALLFRDQLLSVSWKTRSKLAPDIAVFTDAAEEAEVNGGDETFSVHRVMIEDFGSTLRDCGATANDATYNEKTDAVIPTATALGAGWLFVRHESEFGNSIYHDKLPVLILESPYIVTEVGDEYIVSEDGLSLFIAE